MHECSLAPYECNFTNAPAGVRLTPQAGQCTLRDKPAARQNSVLSNANRNRAKTLHMAAYAFNKARHAPARIRRLRIAEQRDPFAGLS